ncbi:MAG: hypothetical protein ACXVBW_10695 [Bdellovibrionota bacterium]
MLRESPWHLRLPSAEHFQWFRNLVDMHEITTQWVRELREDRPEHGLTRGLSREVSENLWMLDSLSQMPMERLLDDTSPSDLLGRLDRTVWAAQAWTLANLFKPAKGEKKATASMALESVLEQSCWRLGRACAEKRWPMSAGRTDADLRRIVLCLQDTPFAGYPRGEGFLVKRLIASEAQLELRSCPHRSLYPEVEPIADALCKFHSHWIRGYAYGLNNRASLDYLPGEPRCTFRWFFVS